MNVFLKQNRFPILILIFTTLCLTALCLLFHKHIFVTEQNTVWFGRILLALFGASIVLIIVAEFIYNRSQLKPLFSINTLLIFSIVILLVFSLFQKQLGIYATGFFVFCALMYFFVKKEFFPLNKVYFFVFLYAVFQMVETRNTPHGFHFPEMSYSFYVLPLSFSLFRLKKQNLLMIAKIVFRIMIVYMAVSIVYWWYNMQILNASVFQWFSNKVSFNDSPAYEFVGKWSHYTHPSYISLVLFSALILGFYLNYKKEKTAFISKFELGAYIALCLTLELAMESRVGLIELLIIVVVSLLYYIKMKSPYLKHAIITGFFMAIIIFFVGSSRFEKILKDDVRKADYTLAINFIKDHPLSGAGYHQQRAALEYEDKQMTDVTRPATAPPITYTHNQFLGDMVQFGIPGLIVLLILLSALTWYAIKSRSYLLQLFMLVYILFMFIEEPLYVQEGITRFMVYLCFFIQIRETDKPFGKFSLRNLFSKRQPA